MKEYLKEYNTAYTTGAFIQLIKGKWIVVGFEDYIYYDGILVKNIETKPYIETGKKEF